MEDDLFSILCVIWKVKNSIAPESTYTSHYYYYSTKTTRNETYVKREGSCILEIHLSKYFPFTISIRKRNYLRQVNKNVKPGAIWNKHLSSLLVLSDFQTFQSQKKNVSYQKQNPKSFFFTARLIVKQQKNYSLSHVSLQPLHPE